MTLVINPVHVFLLFLGILAAYMIFKRTERVSGQGDVVGAVTVGVAVAGVLMLFFGTSLVDSGGEVARPGRGMPSASATPSP
ncbi:hypothetical protein AB0424_28720 [Streptomyces sp. NPDC051180]|uniref:hypothetical protein n=1 Tax=unclassified Streptomyces TaxID=2593676 RepID=UPI00344F92CD